MDALPIPTPEVLDPNRVLGHNKDTDFTADDRPRTELLSTALQETCHYAQQLWDHLNAARQYLLDTLPPDPHASPGSLHTGAAPTGPDDDQGWQKWINAFAATTSVLCGPHGDSGFGLSRAQYEARQRRTAVPMPTDPRPQQTTTSDVPEPTPGTRDATPADKITPDAARHLPRLVRIASTAALVILALRGLRRPRHAGSSGNRANRVTGAT